MTTREIYFKNVLLYDSELPYGLVGYVLKDKDGIIQIGKSICLKLSTDEKVAKESISIMRRVESEPGFMFWNRSDEGEKFFSENWDSIQKYLLNYII